MTQNKSESIEEIHGGQTCFAVGDTRPLLNVIDYGIRSPQKLVLQGDIVAVRPDAEKTVTSGGILVPESAQQVQFNREEFIKNSEQWHKGVVMGVGPGRRPRDAKGRDKAGPRIPLDVEVGDRVVYHRSSSTGIVWTDGAPVALVHADMCDEDGKMMSGIAGVLKEES